MMFQYFPLKAVRLKPTSSYYFSTSTFQKRARCVATRHLPPFSMLMKQASSHQQARLYSTERDEGPWANLDASLDGASSTIKSQSQPTKLKTWSEYMGVENDKDSPWASLDAFADMNKADDKVHTPKSVALNDAPSVSEWEEAAIAAADAYAAKQMGSIQSSSSPAPPRLTHIDERQNDRAAMVDVSNKQETKRIATATCRVYIPEHVLPLLNSTQPINEEGFENPISVRLKGPVMHTAQLAGIMAAKKTSELIPLCHGLHLSHVDVQLQVKKEEQGYKEGELNTFIEVTCIATTASQTGVEMEALTGASVTSLTLWDMLKSVAGKEMRIDGLMVTQKSGGKSGDWERTV